MKKAFVVLVMMAVALALLTAQAINLGSFPLGKWLDPNWGAYWEFSTNNIRILDKDGNVYFDFSKATIRDFKVSVEKEGVVMTFSCDETGKTYKFTKPLTNLNIILEIDRPNQEHYKVEMQKQ
ncbi:MAG TPA: hypothetical protein P5519_09885 [Spirochaetia bacterium]|nr:hypothetical protein [Spirochaetales bacterium]HRS66179.1 hypothetical protein [Spirochaetia bacterium]HRV28887.1 hypothetical protein [Spirochaetia bacterium]